MKKLEKITKSLAPFVLAGAGLIGCSTVHHADYKADYKSQKVLEIAPVAEQGIDLKNGYHAESYKVVDMLDLLASAITGEVSFTVEENGNNYWLKKTGQNLKYDETPSSTWNLVYNEICRGVDNGDKFISEIEIQNYIDKKYGTTVDWVEIDADE